MKSRLPLLLGIAGLLSLVALAAILLTPAQRPAEFNWQGHGTVQVTAPKGWQFHVDSSTHGVTLLCTRDGKEKPRLEIILLDSEDEPRPVDEEILRKMTRGAMELNQPYALERNIEPKRLKLTRGAGWWASFTVAGLVGKSPGPHQAHVIGEGYGSLDERTLLSVSFALDEPDRRLLPMLVKIAESVDVKAPVAKR